MRGADDTKALAVVGAVVVASFALGWAAESQAAAIGSLVLAAAFVLGSALYTMRRAKQVVDVALDEGGLRIDARTGPRSYLPFDELRSASTRAAFGGALLEVTTAAGPRRLVLDQAVPAEVMSALEGGIARRRSAPAAGLESLARGGQPLDAWLLRLRDRAVPDYRERPIEPETLLATFEDRAAPVELRAAAAHMLRRSTKKLGAPTTRRMSACAR